MDNDVVYSCVIANVRYVSKLLPVFVVLDHMSSKWVEDGVADSLYECFLLQILLFAQHVSGTTMPIIKSSIILYGGCCLWYFVLWFSSCWSGVELRVRCPVCRMLQHTAQAATTI